MQYESVIKELYEGNIFPSEQIGKATPTSRAIGKRIDKIATEIADRIGGDREIVEKLGNIYYELLEFETESAFTYGLKLGLRLMAEAACDPSKDAAKD